MSSKTAAEQLAESEYPPQFDRYEWLRASFIKGYAAGQESSRWIPVSERLPEDRSKVLAFSKFPDGKWYQNVTNYHKAHGFLNLQQTYVTHWQPLPEAPKH